LEGAKKDGKNKFSCQSEIFDAFPKEGKSFFLLISIIKFSLRGEKNEQPRHHLRTLMGMEKYRGF